MAYDRDAMRRFLEEPLRNDPCTCPPMRDVMRGLVTQSREPCPVHPMPEGLADKLQPLIKPADHRIDFERYAGFHASGPAMDFDSPQREPNDGNYGMGV
jgi:hypothetical protein